MSNVKSNKLGKIYSIFSVVLIGAIGSGVWDLFLRDFIYYAGELFVEGMSSMYAGYFDRLFEDVGKQSKGLMYLPSIFIIMIIIAIPLFFYIKIKRILRRSDENNNEHFNDRKTRFLLNLAINHQRAFICVFIVPMLALSIMYTDLLIKSVTNISATNSMERWLSVVRPYIDERDYYLLVSEFRMVDNRQSFQLLVNKVKNHAEQHSVLLPKLQIYGIEARASA